nr:hypothetical protein [Acidobacteriota bacterium]
MHLFRAALTAIVIAHTALQAQQPVIPDAVRGAADRITAEQLARDLSFLAADGLLGRNTPSPGFDTAADYIARRLEKAGLTPFGDGGTFFQRFEMHESRVDTAATHLEVDGKAFAFGTDVVIRSLAGPISGSLPLVYVGHGWSIPDKAIDPYAGVDVKGKIVVAHGPRAMPKGIEVKQIGRVTPGASNVVTEAAKRGALGVILVPQTSALAT